MSNLRDIQVMLLRANELREQFPILSGFIAYIENKELSYIKNLQEIICNAEYSDAIGIFYFLGMDINEKFHNTNYSFKDLADETMQLFDKVQDYALLIDPVRTNTIHRTRIAFKKFRYCYEFQIPAYSDCKFSGKQLGIYQTLMGEVQDIEVLINELIEFIENQPHLREMMPVLIYLIDEKRKIIDNFMKKRFHYRIFWNNVQKEK